MRISIFRKLILYTVKRDTLNRILKTFVTLGSRKTQPGGKRKAEKGGGNGRRKRGGGDGSSKGSVGLERGGKEQVVLQTSTDHVLGRVFRETFSGRILSRIRENFSESESFRGEFTRDALRAVLTFVSFQEEIGGEFGENFSLFEKSWGEFWRKTFPRTWSVEVCNSRVCSSNL